MRIAVSTEARERDLDQKTEIGRILRREPAALGRALSSLERGGPTARALLEALRGRGGQAIHAGVSGPAGVGKSSLLRETARRLLARGEPVAVLAVDPVSVVSGGALLGDRIRFGDLQEEPGLFIRSVAHRGEAGKPAPGVSLAAGLLDAAGFRWVFVETVGTGQMDAGVYGDLLLKVLVLSEHSGDDLQMMKAGLVEVADLVAVNKCDQPGGESWAGRLAQVLGAGGAEAETGERRGGKRPRGRGPARVLAVSAATGEGVDAFIEAAQEIAAGKRGTREGGAEP
jgi:LAO/AO transport system kinase